MTCPERCRSHQALDNKQAVPVGLLSCASWRWWRCVQAVVYNSGTCWLSTQHFCAVLTSGMAGALFSVLLLLLNMCFCAATTIPLCQAAVSRLAERSKYLHAIPERTPCGLHSTCSIKSGASNFCMVSEAEVGCVLGMCSCHRRGSD